jgi:hypothetical protein
VPEIGGKVNDKSSLSKSGLSFMDGLQFGCGFFVAGFIYAIGILVVSFVVFGLFGGLMMGALASSF